MRVFVVVKPWDYTYCDCEVFATKLEAEQEIKNGREEKESNSENWRIEEKYI